MKSTSFSLIVMFMNVAVRTLKFLTVMKKMNYYLFHNVLHF